MLCRDCKHLKDKRIGQVSWKFKCGVTNKGILPHLDTVNRNCPLRINKKFINESEDK
nr:MAG TPA: hypothetical protein [Caudoviricetes sp.]